MMRRVPLNDGRTGGAIPPPALFDVDTDVLSTDARSASGLRLLVLKDDAVLSVALPPGRSLVIGRSDRADVHIDDPSVSRLHAVIHVGVAEEGAVPEITLEDLGSANGTMLSGRTLTRGQSVSIAPGEPVQLGLATLVVELRAPSARAEGGWRRALKDEPSASGPRIIAEDERMRAVLERVDQVAPSAVSVMIVGEKGVGKSLVAEAIHRRSGRTGPFVHFDCTSLPGEALEDELFGHEKDATGLVGLKPGLLESADHGTFFFDGFDKLPHSLQSKVLRAIDDGMVYRAGSSTPRRIDVRWVSATTGDPAMEIARGALRKDLYHRLNGVTLGVPPLRERPKDIPALALSFGSQVRLQTGARGAIPGFTAEALEQLQRHPWTGNVHELRQVVARAVLVSGGGMIRPEHLTFGGASEARTADTIPAANADATGDLSDPDESMIRAQIRDFERRRILQVLEECGGNQTRAAKRLGISRRTLISRLDAYDAPRPRKGKQR